MSGWSYKAVAPTDRTQHWHWRCQLFIGLSKNPLFYPLFIGYPLQLLVTFDVINYQLYNAPLLIHWPCLLSPLHTHSSNIVIVIAIIVFLIESQWFPGLATPATRHTLHPVWWWACDQGAGAVIIFVLTVRSAPDAGLSDHTGHGQVNITTSTKYIVI